MIVYCDTSALVKLYAEEHHSEWTRQQVLQAGHCVVSQITWAEMCAAFALKARTGQVPAEYVAGAIERLRAEWPRYTRLALDAPLFNVAGDLALTFGLRAYDSVQLASVHKAHQAVGSALALCCFDKQLNAAAAALGVNVLQP